MRLWHDDVRPPPADKPGWWWAKTNEDARAFLESMVCEECSLDHDLGAVPTGDMDPTEIMYLAGDAEDNGLVLVRWMIENDFVPNKVTIHSWNPAGAMAMAQALDAAGHGCTIRPFVLP